MTQADTRDHLFPACLRALALVLLLGIGTQAVADVEAPAITLSAPESVRELLDSYFKLPETPLGDETARAIFMHRAQREIGELLAAEGYFTPTITLAPAGADGAPALEVVPGPRTLVSQLNLEFTGDLAADDPEHRARVERLRAAWPLAVGKAFRSPRWETAKAALLSSVKEKDYAAAQITASQAEVDKATARAQLTVVIDSGPAFRFGDLVITGLERYQKSLVTRQAPFRWGDAYSRAALLGFQTQLQNLPQFSSAVVSIEADVATPESTHDSVPVQVALTEAKPERVAVGVGYSSNNGARTEINYLDHNFRGRAWNLNSRLRLEENSQTLSAGIDTLPDDDGYKLSWLASDQTTLIQGLKTVDRNLGVTRSRVLGQIETRIGVTWQDEDLRPEGAVEQSTQALALDWQWHRRAVDDPLYPRRGNLVEIRLGGASRQLLSDQDFVRTYLRHQVWWPMGRRDVFSLRDELGYTFAPSRLGIPQTYLFRAGGTQSVRGYAYQSLGVADGAAVVGGRALASGSAEYTHWFGRKWGAALFTDVGDAADNWRDLHFVAGVGAGARWRSPVGPLAVDLARGLASHAWHLHFSIAVAF